jgi:hypothetical protein
MSADTWLDEAAPFRRLLKIRPSSARLGCAVQFAARHFAVNNPPDRSVRRRPRGVLFCNGSSGSRSKRFLLDVANPALASGKRRRVGLMETQYADSDDVARLFRDHVARCSDMMSPA